MPTVVKMTWILIETASPSCIAAISRDKCSPHGASTALPCKLKPLARGLRLQVL